MNIKILQIGTASSSLSVSEYKKDIYRTWNALVGMRIKRAHPELEIECWGFERKFKREIAGSVGGVKFRIFPTTISLRHGMEISLKMLSALLKEVEKAKKARKKIILHFHEYHTWQTYLLLAIADKKLAGIIAQHHGGRSPAANLKMHKKALAGFPLFLLMQYLENRLFKKIDIFYALNDNEISYLRKTAPKSYIRFQTMGIEEEYFKKENKKKAREKLGLEKNKKYALYIGRLKTTKGIKELLDAMKELKEIELFLIGGGVDKDLRAYKKLAREKLATNIRFLGEKYGEEKLHYLSACDCLVLPSYTEGAPVVIMEAVARNLLVIATNVGGIGKMIKNGREGIIIKPKSKEEIARAIKEILRWKAKNMQKYAKKYKWENIIKQTYGDYKS